MNSTDFRVSWDPNESDPPDVLLRNEWLLTNGIGGYASGTLSGVPTRRYHGMLIAALPAPFGRYLFLNHIRESIIMGDGTDASLSMPTSVDVDSNAPQFRLLQFTLDEGLPVWSYELDGVRIQRRLVLLHTQNTILVQLALLGGASSVELHLRPSIHFRQHEETPALENLNGLYSVRQQDGRFEIVALDSKIPPLRLSLQGAQNEFVHHAEETSLLYREEKNRGYPANGSLWSPGVFRTRLEFGHPVTLIASTEPWEAIFALTPNDGWESERRRRERLIAHISPDIRDEVHRQLTFAADQFIISPVGRVADTTKSRALGEEPRSIIAGYHWFTDWGRDTMISLEGLTLVTGRYNEARWILHMFLIHLRKGLIPNLFPEGEREGLYHTADATLWLFQALARYLTLTGDLPFLKLVLPDLVGIIDWHRKGTDFGIGMDPQDGLIRQGAEGYQLTWMDAKVGDWVVTPRRGKAVEINALWYNAVRLLERWLHDDGQEDAANEMGHLAARVYESFNLRFWNPERKELFDVVDAEQGGNDPACRPNQIFSLSLTYPVLAPDRWETIVQAVRSQLLTPYGLRSLSPDHPDYKASYNGDLRSRDAAYHQGTVWAWLIGPFVNAWLRTYPNEREQARSFLEGLVRHLRDAGLGSVSEIFDAEPPFTPRGCIAQAWSVAELMRCWHMLTVEDGRGENDHMAKSTAAR